MKIRKNRDKKKARKDLFHSESAAATVIAAVLLLSIIFSIFVVVRVAYVPEWKNDAEQLHMSEVQTDMTELKSIADMITLLQSVYPVSVPISMGGGEIPVLEPSKSSGTLSVNTENFAMIITPKNHPDIMARGGITYRSNNRQYVDQTFRYENGALILNQDDKSVMKQRPSFNITEDGEYYNVFIRAINVIGDPDTTSSDNDASLTLTLNGSDVKSIDSEDIDSFTCTIFTKYPDAWISFLESKAEKAELTYDYNKIDETNDVSIVIFKFYADRTHYFRFYINESSLKTELGSGSSLDYTTHSSHEENSLPVAIFSSNVSQGYVPLAVQFNDSSENATGWIWDFGDGSKNSYDQNPTHTYSKEGNYTVTLLASNVNGTDSKDSTINVSKLTPTITWSNPANITYGTPLSETQLNASASTPGNYIYRPAAGTLLGVGTHTLHVDFTPTDSVKHTNNSMDVTINVLRAKPLIIWSDPASIIYGTGLDNTQLNAIASNPATGNNVLGNFVYTPEQGTILSAGTHTLQADFTPIDTANYTAAQKNVTIKVLKDYAYITNSASNNVYVIDTANNTVVANVSVGNKPYGVAVNPAGTKAYVANYGSDSVSVIDTVTNKLIATVKDVKGSPFGIAVTPDGSKVYVTSSKGDIVSIINTTINMVTDTVSVEDNPFGVAVNPEGTKVYVTNEGSVIFPENSMSIIDTTTNEIIDTVPVGEIPFGIVVSPDGSKVYITNIGDGTVSIIDTSTYNTINVEVGSKPYGIAVNPSGTKVYVANYGSDNVSVIDTATNIITTSVPVKNKPYGIAVNAEGTKVYVANYGSNTVSIIDAATNIVTTSVPVGANPIAFGQFIVPPP